MIKKFSSNEKQWTHLQHGFFASRLLQSLFALELVLALFGLSVAHGGGPNPEKLMQGYDNIMGPESFEALASMTSTREDGSVRTYEMKMMKSGTDKFRVLFTKPAAVMGQEILRVLENNWLYLPQLKRSSRIASRESFQGGDFNNADILRVNYLQDYSVKLLGESAASAQSSVPPKDPSSANEVALELSSKSESSSYEKINLWVLAESGAPVRAQFFGASGKLMRSAEYLEYKKLDGKVPRPTKIIMKNELLPKRTSELVYSSLKTGVSFRASLFVATDLGK